MLRTNYAAQPVRHKQWLAYTVTELIADMVPTSCEYHGGGGAAVTAKWSNAVPTYQKVCHMMQSGAAALWGRAPRRRW